MVLEVRFCSTVFHEQVNLFYVLICPFWVHFSKDMAYICKTCGPKLDLKLIWGFLTQNVIFVLLSFYRSSPSEYCWASGKKVKPSFKTRLCALLTLCRNFQFKRTLSDSWWWLLRHPISSSGPKSCTTKYLSTPAGGRSLYLSSKNGKQTKH